MPPLSDHGTAVVEKRFSDLNVSSFTVTPNTLRECHISAIHHTHSTSKRAIYGATHPGFARSPRHNRPYLTFPGWPTAPPSLTDVAS